MRNHLIWTKFFTLTRAPWKMGIGILFSWHPLFKGFSLMVGPLEVNFGWMPNIYKDNKE